MKNTFTLFSLILLSLFTKNASFGQIVSYTNATNGSLNLVAANATGTNLARVNGASSTASPCNTGFSSSNFSSTGTYSSSLAAVEVNVTPKSGFSLNVTGFTADLGRSGSGPANIRFAYSTNGGSTWTAQSSNQSIQSGRCGKVRTKSWSTSTKVNAPATLKFRIYGFNAKKTSGTEQILNLKINGTVSSSVSCGVASGLSALNVASSSATLDWNDVSGATGYNIQYRKIGTATWISKTSTTSSLAVSALTASTTYEFQVQTVCSGGTTSVFSSSVTFTTAASSSCAVATGRSAINITSSSATLDWNDVSGVISYNIQYRKTGTATWTRKTSISSSLAVSALTASTTYEFQVQTVCSGGTTSAFSSSATFTTTSSTGSNPVPAFTHIVVVIGENTNASSVFGNSNAPYINALASVGAKFTNSFAITHPSQPNYLHLYSGSNQGVTNDNYITTKFTTANLGKELINAGKTYTTYSEGLPSVGYDGATSGLYVRKHNPAANWMGTGTNQIPTTTNQPFTAFPTNYNNLPSVSFVIPNMCNDGHDVCAPLNNSTLQYDTWIKNNLDAYKKWCVNNNSLLIVTYDEDDFTPTNKIATVFYGANVVQGVYSQTINHYNVLRTIEDAFRLTSHAGAAASATPIDFCWTSTTALVARVYSSTLNESNTSTIDIFPNPANDKINIMLSNMVQKNVSWVITTISGIKYKAGNINISRGGQIEIAVDDLKNGIYFLRISDGVNTRANKFVIAR